MLAIPQDAAPPPAISVNVIEFYHTALDHYFINSIAKEISDLDTGVQEGWMRTGESFRAYDLGSGGPIPNGVPVYRTWNNRADSNHRYTTSKAIRDQMIAQGHVAEGYGPDAVALCALQ